MHEIIIFSIHHQPLWEKRSTPCAPAFLTTLFPPSPSSSFSHHDRLKETDEGAETAPLLYECPAHCLLLCLLHQQAHVSHVLHRAVQLGLQVPSACHTITEEEEIRAK